MNQSPLTLIIEDEESLLVMEEVVLEQAGYRVCGFPSAEEALASPPEIIREADLALVDATFGGLPAVQALRRINPRIRTAIPTGLNFDPHPDVDRILAMPFSIEDLLREVRDLLGR
jgi:DNA-binding NtrC family response regulator